MVIWDFGLGPQIYRKAAWDSAGAGDEDNTGAGESRSNIVLLIFFFLIKNNY